ncbi:helix-turn-helix transcriptional regulator [Nonomuraea basaltis]|uniref:helix-turn-helix transcriptional regulator n=1 Tax=Nonomuraea basaltis TaxID=2495887 RepID=UPI00110C65E4|nr:YafY family protein [Nonomuraea basaltis]TMR98303.1 YafY family transcriptional regulator [Nonomuraea basaltis]
MSESRLLSLLSLLQTPREWPGGELADRLGVSRRTIRRDVERLRALGYPVEATMGADGGYRLVAGTAMPPLLLDDEEAVAITVGLSTAARHPVQGIEEASVRALAKLEQVLPSRLRYRVRSLGSATVPMPSVAGPEVDPEQLTTLATAVANRERVRFAYRAHDGVTSTRVVDPHRVVAAARQWYLLGHDRDRDDWRIFRIDRISDLRATGARIVPREPPAEDAAAYVAEKLYSSAPTHEAVVTLHTSVTELIKSLGEVTPIDERTCRLRTHADTLDWLAFRLAALGCEFEVHEPPELNTHLRALAARLTRAAG